MKPATVSIYQVPKAAPPAAPLPPRADYYRAIQLNTSVRKEVIDSLGGIEDTLKPIEESLKQHEMRPFDVEPNYYDDLMMSRNPSHFKAREQSGQITTRSEFLKKSLKEKNFATSYGKIVSASPFRAVVRRMDYNTDVT